MLPAWPKNCFGKMLKNGSESLGERGPSFLVKSRNFLWQGIIVQMDKISTKEEGRSLGNLLRYSSLNGNAAFEQNQSMDLFLQWHTGESLELQYISQHLCILSWQVTQGRLLFPAVELYWDSWNYVILLVSVFCIGYHSLPCRLLKTSSISQKPCWREQVSEPMG